MKAIINHRFVCRWDTDILLTPAEISGICSGEKVSWEGIILREGANSSVTRVSLVIAGSVQTILERGGMNVAYTENEHSGLMLYVTQSVVKRLLHGETFSERWNYRDGAKISIETENEQKHMHFLDLFYWEKVKYLYAMKFWSLVDERFEMPKMRELLASEKLKLLHGEWDEKVIEAIEGVL
jgi:hypothetical protein